MPVTGKYIRILAAVLLASLLVTQALAHAREEKKPWALPIAGPTVSDIDIFAYPGKTCPGGSQLYRGPEAAEAEKSGAVYCMLRKKVEIFEKSGMPKCPPPIYLDYKDANLKPPPDIIWCTLDPHPVIPPPPPPWVETPPPPQ